MKATKTPCPDHPEAGRYSNGACKQHAIDAQKKRYQERKDELKAYAREHAKTYVRPERSKEQKARYDRERYLRIKASQ